MENLKSNTKIKELERDIKMLETKMNAANKTGNIANYHFLKRKHDTAQHELDTERNIERFANSATKTHGISEVRVPHLAEV